MNLINNKFFQIVMTIVFLCLSQITVAGSNMENMSEGCKSCIRTHDCSRINKTCNATCRANLYSENIDLESCRGACIGKLEKCLLSANQSCSFYCKAE